ncbi:MAG: DUF222 domain-containing protein [Kineosporiaceae bacterium]
MRLFEQLVSRVAAARLHLIAELDARPGAVAGAAAGRVAQTFLTGACRVGAGQAGRDVAAARTLPIATAAATLDTAADTADLDPTAAATDPAAVAGVVVPGSLMGGGGAGRLPVLAAAFAAGAVSRAHVDVAVKALSRIPSHLLAHVDEEGRSGLDRVDAFLTEQAHRHSPATLDRLVRHLVEVVDPDGSGGFDPRAHERRSCTTAVDSLGMLVGRFALDPVGALTFATAMDAFASVPPPGTAADEHGEVVEVGDTRTRDQRRADALVLMAEHALTSPGAPVRAQVSVVTTLDHVTRAARAHTYHCTATSIGSRGEGGAGVPAPTAAVTDTPRAGRDDDHGDHAIANAGHRDQRNTHGDQHEPHAQEPASQPGPWLAHADGVGPISDPVLAHTTCDAVLTRLTLTPSGAPLDVGRSLRLATPTQRRALTARDKGCVIPGCGVPANGCDAHHVVHWGDGGATDLDNLALLCPRHHAAHHQGVWDIEIRDGIPWVIPPPWVDPHRRALLNTTHADAARASHLAQHLRNPHAA